MRDHIQLFLDEVVALGFSIHKLRLEGLDLIHHFLPRGFECADQSRVYRAHHRSQGFNIFGNVVFDLSEYVYVPNAFDGLSFHGFLSMKGILKVQTVLSLKHG